MLAYQNIKSNPQNKQKKYYFRCRIKYNEWQKLRRIKNPQKIRNWQRIGRLRKFGITQKEYEILLKKQKGVCAICGSKPDTRWQILAVDHDHNTGKVRGLLCMVCNTMLGRFEKRYNKIKEYLQI